jgi:mevalonate kinase
MQQTFSAPAKIILLGEHAVVYGQPSLAIPLSALRSYAKITPPESNSGLEVVAADLGNQEFLIKTSSSKPDHPLISAAYLLLDFVKCNPPNVRIVLHSDIPIASGMGSGAAITTCLFRALLYALDKSLGDEQLNSLVYEVEKIHHGTPSGVDNTVVVFEKPIYFVRGKPIEKFEIKQPFTLLVGNTGIEASTKVAVGDVRKLYNSDQTLTENKLSSIGQLVQSGRNALEKGDLLTLGHVMLENHRLLRDLTVSSDTLDSLVNAAVVSGALGAKLSGGGRGGNMIALVLEEHILPVKNALFEAGATQVYQTVVGQ